MPILSSIFVLVTMALCLAPSSSGGTPADQMQPYRVESTFTRKNVE